MAKRKPTKTDPTPQPSSPSSKNSSLLDLVLRAKTLEELREIARQIDPQLELPPPRMQRRKKRRSKYETKRIREAARQRANSREKREIAGDCPPCVDIATRDRILDDLLFALLTLFPKRFYLPSSQDQLDLIEFIKQTIRTGGQLAVAMPRSTGKTNILLCSIIWAILTGLHPFVLLEQIQTEFQTNDRLRDYFPELIHPIRKLEGISQRRLLWNGKLIVQTWKKDRVILPNNIAGPGHGAVIAVAGLDGRIRGLNYQRHDGENVRPSLVLVDDPQTRKTAASIPSTNKRELVLDRDIMGLAGPDKQIPQRGSTIVQTVSRPQALAHGLVEAGPSLYSN